MDREKTGFITAADLEETMMSAGLSISNGEIKRIMDEIKCPASNKIKYSDFLVAAFDRKRLMNEELLYLTFKRCDVVRDRQDNDGYVNSKDMRTTLFNLGSELEPSEMEQAMAQYDQNDDHLIDFEEFKSIVQQKESEVVLSAPAVKIKHKSMKLLLSQVANDCS
jgi:Ca2+-binding EF-hand superfamily protein